MATNGVQSVQHNISAIFGSKQGSQLLEIMALDENLTKSDLEEFEPNSSVDIINDVQEVDISRFNINGWISSCNHGCGRSSKDRQFIYINSRPCEPKKILKLINDVYHQYNGNQSPFVYLNIMVQRSEVDVNITPDKRQLLVNNENILLLVLKKCLSKTFGDVPSTFKIQNLNLTTNRTVQICKADSVPNPKKFSQMLLQWKKTGRTDNACSPEKIAKRKLTTEVESRTMKMRKIQEYLSQNPDDTVALSDDDTLSTTMDHSVFGNNLTGDMDTTSSCLTQPESTSIPEQQQEFNSDKYVCNAIFELNTRTVQHQN